ncbi:MAG: phosphoribosylformylglycinamidine synthase [Clostridia bacterium]
MSNVYRVYVEKKENLRIKSENLAEDIKQNLGIARLDTIRIVNRYDVEGISKAEFEKAKVTIFSEPTVDDVSDDLNFDGYSVVAVEFLPGQFDQRADSCAQCISLLTENKRPIVKSATIYLLKGNLNDIDIETIKEYLINPVEARLASLNTYDSLQDNYKTPTTVATIDGFITLSEEELSEFLSDYSLAMDLGDVKFCQQYFRDTEKRDPTITEIRMIDTYWSDHCRHTTFSTNIEKVEIAPSYIKEAYDLYITAREDLNRKNKPICLMDIATIGMKYLKSQNKMPDLDLSDEINACSVKIKVEIDGKIEDYLLMFKNETHNHPTEIEPFGGAATCLGGAIRDPLSGRVYVYQAMRVTGAASPYNDTIKGKLPQRKIMLGAANGYSSYGNQIGLATGIVNEFYHEGYKAKRLEIGAVIGAAPEKNVIRCEPIPSDIVILIGGKTGRDGCGGATGSSKSHTTDSIKSCGAEVQKGNPPEERKIQRLFRDENVTKLIKRCNDFGAGGISVAVGELADGLTINLDAVPKKYEGLDGTELAISESQERMAVVVAKENANLMIELCKKENLEATIIATVTDENRLTLNFCGNKIVDISRDFLNSNGASKYTDVAVLERDTKDLFKKETSNIKEDFVNTVSSLNVCSQKGLVENFDSTIGASTVLMPFGGKYQMSPSYSMVAKIPTKGNTDDCSVMAYGFNPYLSEKSPFHGAVYAVVESVSKIIATGGTKEKIWLTLQEYFPRTQNDKNRWGMVFEALLGAMYAQVKLGYGAIGGKDSMSGTFEDIDVPPTLVSFAVSVSKAARIVSSEFKKENSNVYLVEIPKDENNLPNFEELGIIYKNVQNEILKGNVLSSFVVTSGGVCEAISKMSFGNKIGFEFDKDFDESKLFSSDFGNFVLECKSDIDFGSLIGKTSKQEEITIKDIVLPLDELIKAYEKPLEKVYKTNVKTSQIKVPKISYNQKFTKSAAIKVAKPKIVIPVFPGTNCEYDTEKAFNQNGGDAKIIVINNQNESGVKESILELEKAIRNSQIVMLPGGFSGGDEPDGSGKFIATFFRNSRISDAVSELLEKRDGLMLGICNGFQALIKLGLVPYGEIRDLTSTDPTLSFNTIYHHKSSIVQTRIATTNSPWLAGLEVGDIHNVAISHGEGRFLADDKTLDRLIKNGQIATQYVDLNGEPTMDINFNPNQSVAAIEGIISENGRVLGKMGHSERVGENLYKNVIGNYDQKIFAAGINYFK